MSSRQDWQMIVDFWRIFKRLASISPFPWDEFTQEAVAFGERYGSRLAKDLMLVLGDEMERRDEKR